MKLYNLIHESGRRTIYFPLSQVFRMTPDQTNHGFGYEDLKTLINQYLKPLLAQNGFTGQDFFYYRIKHNKVESVLIARSKSNDRKSICVDVHIKKYNGEPQPLNSKQFDQLEDLSPKINAWKRLSPDDQDCLWKLRESESENRKVLNEVFKIIELEGERFFRKHNRK